MSCCLHLIFVVHRETHYDLKKFISPPLNVGTFDMNSKKNKMAIECKISCGLHMNNRTTQTGVAAVSVVTVG